MAGGAGRGWAADRAAPGRCDSSRSADHPPVSTTPTKKALSQLEPRISVALRWKLRLPLARYSFLFRDRPSVRGPPHCRSDGQGRGGPESDFRATRGSGAASATTNATNTLTSPKKKTSECISKFFLNGRKLYMAFYCLKLFFFLNQTKLKFRPFLCRENMNVVNVSRPAAMRAFYCGIGRASSCTGRRGATRSPGRARKDVSHIL